MNNTDFLYIMAPGAINKANQQFYLGAYFKSIQNAARISESLSIKKESKKIFHGSVVVSIYHNKHLSQEKE